MSDKVAQRLDALEKAVADLQQHHAFPAKKKEIAPGEVDHELLERLRNRSGGGFVGEASKGSLVYAGVGEFGGNAGISWYVERPIPGILAQDNELLTTVLAALGSPPRMALVKRLFQGVATNKELQDTLGDAVSVGQLYHHVKELVNAGIIEQPKRGLYEIPKYKRIPLAVILAAVADLQ